MAGRPPPDRARLGIPLPPEGAVRTVDGGPVEGSNAGRPVFRVRGTMALRLGRMVTIPILLVGGLLAGPLWGGVSIPGVLVVAACAGAAAVLVGRRLPDDRCSEPRCNARLRPDDRVCPRCRGIVAGVIDHPQERLEALDRLEREGWRAPKR